ncbi:GNAT family N-acetyltransferase [Paenibacillus tarimensis]
MDEGFEPKIAMRESIRFETASLRLREFALEDYNALYALTTQQEITDILPDWNMTEVQLKRFLAFVIDSYDKFQPDDVRILLAIVHKGDQKLIGWCGVFPNDKLEPQKREIAYAMHKDYRNCGYTTEAVMGMVAYVFGQSSLSEIVAIVKPFNTASRRVVEKAGFIQQSTVRLSDGEDYDYFTIRPSGYGIRKINEENIGPYLNLLAEVEHVKLNRNNPNHEQWLRRRIKSFYARGAMYYACHDCKDDEMYGIVAVLHEEPPEGIPALGARSEVLQIGVNRHGRRKGIGSILLKHAEEVVKKRGAHCLLMMTYAEDDDVIAFYGKNGYVPVAALPDVYGPGLEGNVFLRKILR